MEKSRSDNTSAAPPVELTDATPDVLLTWVDEQGEFHVTQTLADIKDPHRANVRVVFAGHENTDPDQVYVADLTHKRDNGSYSVRTMPRSAWDELGAKNRKSRMEAVAVRAPATPDAGLALPNAVVVIYGAEWCGACKQTAAYLKQKGVKFVEKDVDQSATIQAELQAKFARAHVPPSSSIPVVDIGGRLIVGFNPAAIDAALAALSSVKTL